MEKIKNLTSSDLNLQSLGIILNPNEIRDIAEFATRNILQNNASFLNDLVYTDKIAILSADHESFSKVEAIQYISNAYSKVIISNTADLTSKGKYYFLKDSFNIKNQYIIKTFKGYVDSIYIIPDTNVCEITITTGDGLVLPTDEIIKRQTFELETGGKLYNPSVKIYSNYTNTINIFMDGTSDEETDVLQDFIDNWRE